MSLYQRLLGHPFVYDRIRPWVVGGIDWAPLYQNLAAGADDVILDVGCGTGIAHQYLSDFRAYFGFDTDPVAIKAAADKTAGPKVHYECRAVTPADVARIRPTRVILAGLLHHLSDEECLALLQAFAAVPSIRRIASSDVVYLPGEHVSNLLAFFDRGKFVRRRPGFLDLPRRAGLRVVREEIVPSHPTNGKALYLLMTLEPGPS